MKERIYLYDSTLRDGAQAHGVDFTLADKQAIATALDEFGIDYIEGGWPGANPIDDEFFAALPAMGQARISAFGMTRRAGQNAANDGILAELANSAAPTVCIVGKSWDFHVDKALEIERSENLAMIGESIAYLVAQGKEVCFDSEHFFDGYKANPEFALSCIKAAHDNGARWIVLCDTNGGSLPHEIENIINAVTPHISGDKLGIHCHNDTGNAVANSLVAVQCGVRQVQGTINGVGERCGNANLITLLPSLMLKMGYKTGVSQKKLQQLTKLSRMLDDRLNRAADTQAPYVGSSAFAHKGGLHVSAVAKNPSSYEHIDPALVGNKRNILVSDKAGRSNVVARLKQMGLEISAKDGRIPLLLATIKDKEQQGYAYEGADASFELLARNSLEHIPEFYTVNSFRVIDERRWNARSELITLSEATIKLTVKGQQIMTVAEGNGPVNALDNALRKGLITAYPQLAKLRLVDYKVRILTTGEGNSGTNAVTRVLIESNLALDLANAANSANAGTLRKWSTVGVSGNVIDASFNALNDSITFCLLHSEL
jgi:2-isopropylmalate synthase